MLKYDSGRVDASSTYAPARVKPWILVRAASLFAPISMTSRPQITTVPVPRLILTRSAPSMSCNGRIRLLMTVRSVRPVINSGPAGPWRMNRTQSRRDAMVLPDRTAPS